MSAYETAAAQILRMDTLAQKLALEIGTRASLRDAQSIRNLWAELDRIHQDLPDLMKAFRDEDRHSRKDKSSAKSKLHRRKAADFRKMRGTVKFHNYAKTLVEKHIDPARERLIVERESEDTIALLRLVSLTMHKMANPHRQSETSLEYGCMPDILLPLNQFEQLMMTAYRVLNVLGRLNKRWIIVHSNACVKISTRVQQRRSTSASHIDKLRALGPAQHV